ncbi:hypothetical protein WJX82_010106 [Trebouxia sp. C0006]
MAEARTAGKAGNASQSKKQKVNGTGHGSNAGSKGSASAPGFDPTLCSCGENKLFCRDRLCFNLYYTRAEYGIESDEDSDNDPYGY